MFCSHCGTSNPAEARFCNNCGAPLQPLPSQTPPPAQESVIDLRGTVNHSAPAEKSDKGAIFAAILMVVGWVIFALAGSAFAESTGVDHDDGVLQKLLVVATLCVPIFLIGYPVARVARKRSQVPPLERGPMIVTCGYCWLLTACITALAFLDLFAAPGLGDLVMIVLVFFTGAAALMFLIFAGVASSQHGKAIRYQLLTGYFFSFLPGALLGFLLATLIAAMGFLMILALVVLIVFFANGGILIYRNQS